MQWRTPAVFGLVFALWMGAGLIWNVNQSRIKGAFTTGDGARATVTVKWKFGGSDEDLARQQIEAFGDFRYWLPRSEDVTFYLRPRLERGEEFVIQRFLMRQAGFDSFDALAAEPYSTRDVVRVGDNRWKVTGEAPRIRYRVEFDAGEYSSSLHARQMLPWALWGLLVAALAVASRIVPWARVQAETLLGIDPRALATLRIGLATIILFDLWARAGFLAAHYTDHGVLPRAEWMEFYTTGASEKQLVWSLHLLGGSPGSQALLFGLSAIGAMMMLVGYRTRLATILCWVLAASLQSRNPLVCQGGDTMLRMMLFWCMFLPLGLRWSVDGRRGTVSPPSSNDVLSFATAAILIQMVYIYIGTAVSKSEPMWTEDFSAVHYTLYCEDFTTRFGLWVRQFTDLLPVLTVATLALEYIGPLLAFSLWKTKPIRILVVFGFWAFHLGTHLTMQLGGFPWISYVAWTVFLPDTFWDRVQRSRLTLWLAGPFRLLIKLGDTVLPRLPHAPKGMPLSHGRAGRVLGWAANAAIVFLLLYMLVWNIRQLKPQNWLARQFKNDYDKLGYLLRIDQDWRMFAGIPDTSWYVIKGTLRNGEVVNLWHPGAEVSSKKPDLVSDFYAAQRWRKHLMHIADEQYEIFRRPFADWLRWRWDTHHTKGDPKREVWKVEIDRTVQETPPPGAEMTPPTSRHWWTSTYPSQTGRG